MRLSKAIGNNIQKLRIKRGMTQDALAQALFVTRQTVSNYETGRSNPNIDTLQQIADVLHTDIHFLLYGDQLTEEKRLSKRRTVISAAVFLTLLTALMILYPICVVGRNRHFIFAPYLLVRTFLVPAVVLVLGWLLLQAIDYFYGIKRIPKAFDKVGKIAVYSFVLLNLAVAIPYLIFLLVLLYRELSKVASIEMTFGNIPVYRHISYFFLNIMMQFPFVYILVGMLVWIFPLRKGK